MYTAVRPKRRFHSTIGNALDDRLRTPSYKLWHWERGRRKGNWNLNFPPSSYNSDYINETTLIHRMPKHCSSAFGHKEDDERRTNLVWHLTKMLKASDKKIWILWPHIMRFKDALRKYRVIRTVHLRSPSLVPSPSPKWSPSPVFFAFCSRSHHTWAAFSKQLVAKAFSHMFSFRRSYKQERLRSCP